MLLISPLHGNYKWPLKFKLPRFSSRWNRMLINRSKSYFAETEENCSWKGEEIPIAAPTANCGGRWLQYEVMSMNKGFHNYYLNPWASRYRIHVSFYLNLISKIRRDHWKYFLWALHLWVGWRYRSLYILGYISNSDGKKSVIK